MEMSALTFYVLLGSLAGGLIQGLSGFAFGLVAMTFWVWVLPPQVAGPLVVFGSLVGQLLSLGWIRPSFVRQRLWPLVLGGCSGTPIGAWMLHYIDPTVFKMAVGLILGGVLSTGAVLSRYAASNSWRSLRGCERWRNRGSDGRSRRT